ncbi:uncharacterized protein CC84DRAFT_1209746 [Paraphaeosphaeria sporulosa]|uniref:RTA1-domain-containing protein n=1 Tax=Paraphaeosphaeria sporulosa TaxID=1460663 RepID=A0A177BZS4_9PLEO|nr:uncharacterized protein CC84DRAFT_1209746 [Paraphaeosphaeria sporulosa]OAG00048.1 hypothetical protein CC84DRAFT_1209746 [Paraphaeosphaeria sporulosa]
MHSSDLSPLGSAGSDPEEPSTSRSCPTTTVKPDANGWVPPGTCGYISRPYYPSFNSALISCAAAVLVLLGFSLLISRSAYRRNRQLRNEGGPSWGLRLFLPWIGAFIATFFLAAYVLRAFGTKYQQTPEFVAISDTFVLICPILIFALDCIVLTRLMTAYCQDGKVVGVTGRFLARALLITIPLTAIEQLVASILIAPKHRASSPGRSSSTAILGLKLYLIGIGIQEVLVVYALIIAILVSMKFGDNETVETRAKMTHTSSQLLKKWRSMMYALIFSLTAIGARIAYRLIELSGVFTGYLLVLMHNEIFFYSLDCLPALAALGIWAIVGFEDVLDHPSLNTMPIGAYAYHELNLELEMDHDNVSSTIPGDKGSDIPAQV